MIVGFFWREHMARGGQRVSPRFDSPQEAGQWRRENPPLLDGHGPTLVKTHDGYRAKLSPGELTSAFTQFADREERMDYSAEGIRLP